ncbi:MAG: dihydrolipoyl dehydrogenase [Bacteroidaceae bacterium]|nr:dihydrolipoyl dehydrogenase [Bacteroidaceae bacterium]
MTNQTTDLIIIGSGPGGYRAAQHAASQGLKVVIIEQEHAGGTCLNCGCIPTKTLCHSAEVADTIRRSAQFGIMGADTFTIDFQQVMARTQTVVETLRHNVEMLMQAPGITLVSGHAQFADPHTIVVGDDSYSAPHIIIATGSQPAVPPIDGINLPHVLDSTHILSRPQLPHNLCIIGAGVVGMEFASAYNLFGSSVSVVEFQDECLPAIDADVARRVRQTLSRRGVSFYMQSAVTSIGADTVTFERKGKTQTIEADTVLIATGRKPRTDGLQLELAGIHYDPRGITVDQHFRTTQPHIFAIGDVNGLQMLAHAATYQGLHAVDTLLGRTTDAPHPPVPAAVFTHPQAAAVGPTQQQCTAQGIDFECRKTNFRANGMAAAMGETDGLLKLIIRSDDRRIIACHVCGPHAADIVHEATALITCNATIDQLHHIIHIHPTLGEILQEV